MLEAMKSPAVSTRLAAGGVTGALDSKGFADKLAKDVAFWGPQSRSSASPGNSTGCFRRVGRACNRARSSVPRRTAGEGDERSFPDHPVQSAEDAEAIDRLHERTFGPGRYARTAFRIREESSIGSISRSPRGSAP